MPKPWMIYGANGYTGELIAREAVSCQLRGLVEQFGKRRVLQRHDPELRENTSPAPIAATTALEMMASTIDRTAEVLGCGVQRRCVSQRRVLRSYPRTA
jgi:short subunit dehydrogenase-like uncharacterized protein